MAFRASTFVKGILGLLLLVIIAAVGLIALFDPNDYKNEIQAAVEEKTGRTLTLNAPLEWTFYPWLGVSTGDLALGNRAGFGDGHFLSAKRASVRVKLMPLLKGDFVADTFVLDGAEFHLQVNRDGSDNWSDLVASNGSGDGPASGDTAIKRININGTDIRNSQITFNDMAAGNSYRADIRQVQTGIIDMKSPIPLSLDLSVSGSTLQETALKLNGTLGFDLDKQRYRLPDLELTLKPASGEPASLVGGLEVDVPSQKVMLSEFRLNRNSSSASGNLEMQGFAGVPALNGRLSLKQFVASDFLALVGGMDDGAPLMKAPISGSLDFEGGENSMRLPSFDLTLDGQKVAGSFNATSLNPLQATFDLDAGNLDIDKLTGTASGKETGKGRKKEDPGSNALSVMKLAGDVKIASLTTGGMRIENIVTTVDLADNSLKLDGLSAKALGVPVSGNMTVTDPTGKLAYEGALKVSSFSPRDLLKQLGASAPTTADAKALGKAGGNLEISGGANRVRIKTRGFQLDDSVISGAVTLLGFSKPAYKFNLSVNAIDLDRYLPPKRGDSGKGGGADDSHKALRGLDMNGKIAIGSLKASGIRLGKFRTDVAASGSKLRLTDMSGTLYKGRFSGDITLNAAGKSLAWSANETFTGVSVAPLLKALADSNRLTGTMNMKTSLSGSGTNINRILSTVSGKASFDFRNGTIRGVNIAQVLRDVKARLKGQRAKKVGQQKTDFSEMTGSAVIKNGIVTNNDLVAKSPFLRVTGKGTINLPQSSMNYLTNIKVVKTSKGQGGKEFKELEGLTIPVRIKGPFSNLSYYPDIEQLLKQRAEQELEEKKKELEEKAREKLRDKLDLGKESKKKEIKEKTRKKARKKAEDKLKEDLLKKLGL